MSETIIMEQPAALVAITKKEQLTDDTAALIIERFTPIWEQIDEWKTKAETLVVTDVSQVNEMKMAGEARKALKKMRTTANSVREELKAESIRYGRAVQGLYNEIESRIKPIEEHLEMQEKFKEIQEANRKNDLRIEREKVVEQYRDFVPYGIDFGDITESDFEKLINGARLQKQAAEEAAVIAEEQRKQRELDEELERNRIRIENERLKAEAEEREKEIQSERERLEKEQRAANIAAAKAKKEADAKLAAERAERERVEAELRAKQEADAKAEIERLASIEAELSKGDKEKMTDLITKLGELPHKYQFKSKKHQTIHKAIIELVEKTTNYATSKL